MPDRWGDTYLNLARESFLQIMEEVEHLKGAEAAGVVYASCECYVRELLLARDRRHSQRINGSATLLMVKNKPGKHVKIELFIPVSPEGEGR